MRSARYFAADHGIKLPSKKGAAASSEADDAEDTDETPGSRGGQKHKADWFLHDDRDEDRNADAQNRQPDAWDTRASQTGFDNRRGGGRRGSGRTEPGRTVPLVVQSTQWHYVDPEGNVQGPFDAKKLLNWIDLGYFGQTDLKVRQQGREEWGNLTDAKATIRKQAAGDATEPHDRAQEPLRNTFNRNDDQPRGRGRGSSSGRGRRQQDEADILPVMPEGQKHPAEALLAPADPNEEDQSQRRPNRRGAADASGSDQASRGRGAAVGGRGGRGGRGYSQEGAGSQEQPRGRNAAGGAGGSAKASRSKAAWVLFTADSRSAAHEPVWRYIDPDGTTQGPFSAKEMHSWFEGNYLQTELPVCGVNKAIATADVPRPLYKSLGQLLRQAERGQPFRPLQQKDLTPPAQQPATGAVLVVPRPANQQASAQRAPRQRAAQRQAAPQAAPAPAAQALAEPAAEAADPQDEAAQPPDQGETADTAQVPMKIEGADASASAEPVPPETEEAAPSPQKDKANAGSGSSNDEAESVVARSNASDDESEEGEIRGRDAATDEDEDDVDATEAAASSTDPLQASAVADAASTTRADQVPDVEEQPEPSDYTHAIPRTLDFDTSTAADRAPASGVPQAPSTNDHSQAAATDHSDSSDAEMAPAADTDQGPSADRGSHAATNTDQASSSEAAQNSIENQEYADAPAPDTDDAKQSAYRHAGIKLSVIQGDQEAQQANTAGETTSGGGHTDAAPEDKPSTSMAAESVPEDSRSAYEHADAKLAAIQGAGHNEQPETSHGDVDTSTKQAEAPPVNTEAEDPVQIKEVTQAEAEASSTAPEDAGQQAGSSSPRKAKSPGIMQSVLGAAKTLLGGKSDEEAVKEDDNKNSSEAQDMEQGLGEPSQSYVIEPETSESEATESVTNSEHQADGNQQVDNPAARSFSKAASFTSVDQDVADLQTGMENVRIEEPAEDTADDAKSNSSHVSAQSHISPSRNEAHTSEHAAAATDVE